MTWQKALFYGGAILILTACGSPTAPTAPAQAAQLHVTRASDSLDDSTSTESGYYVRAGSGGLRPIIPRALP